MARHKRRNFTPELKPDAVRLVRQVGSVGKVTKGLDLTETAVRGWIRHVGRRAIGALRGREPVRIRVDP
jgi:transposase-like protein